MILTDPQRRALTFVAAANRGGYRPTEREVEEWRLRPAPRPGKRGRMISPGTPGTPPPWAATIAAVTRPALEAARIGSLRLLSNENLLGTAGTPPQYELTPPETFVASLRRLGWLVEDERGGAAVTELGRALLREEELADRDSEGAETIVLNEGDPLAWGSLLGHVADAGDALIVDPYLRADQLFALLQHTRAIRFLVSRLSDKDRAAMATLLAAPGWQPGAQVREVPRGELHDRFIVSDERVHMLGTSFNGVGGKNTTLLLPVPELAADQIRAGLERRWTTASIVGTAASQS